jgi:hypothetical protein
MAFSSSEKKIVSHHNSTTIAAEIKAYCPLAKNIALSGIAARIAFCLCVGYDGCNRACAALPWGRTAAFLADNGVCLGAMRLGKPFLTFERQVCDADPHKSHGRGRPWRRR